MAQGGWKTKWSDEQKAALVAAMLDHGRTTKEAVALAHAGELPIGAEPGKRLDPFPIPLNTVTSLRAVAGRQRRAIYAATLDPDQVMAKTIGELQAMLTRQVDRNRIAIARGATDAPERIARLARAAREVDATTQAYRKRQQPTRTTFAPNDDGEQPAAAPDLIDAIAAEMPRK